MVGTMDPVQIIALRKIEEAQQNGVFDNLPRYERIDCSLHGELFVAKWWRQKIEREQLNRID